MSNRGLTHLDETGAARMVDVGGKDTTDRIAVAEGHIALSADALEIPPSLKSAALDLAVVAYSIRAAGTLLDPKGARAAARDAALRLLQDVAAGKFAVEATGNAADEPAASQPGPAINEPESVL